MMRRDGLDWAPAPCMPMQLLLWMFGKGRRHAQVCPPPEHVLLHSLVCRQRAERSWPHSGLFTGLVMCFCDNDIPPACMRSACRGHHHGRHA